MRIFSSIVLASFCTLALLLTSAGTSIAAPAAGETQLDSVEWTLTELKGKPVQAVEGMRGSPTLRFNSEKKQANGFSGVNRFFGSYEAEGGKLKFGTLAGTRMAGPPAAMALEQEFLAMLGGVTHSRIKDGDTLELL